MMNKTKDFDFAVIKAKKDFTIKADGFLSVIKKGDDVFNYCGVPARFIPNLITEGVIDKKDLTTKTE
jgi:hypothetical protein